ELVRYFYKLFFDVDRHSPQSKETSQALSLVAQHGLPKGRFVVEFARAEAEKTAFQIQHFGGVLPYASRALAAFERKVATTESFKPAASSAVAKERREERRFKRGEARLKILTPDQQAARFEQARVDLLRQNPFLAGKFGVGSAMHEAMVRARL